MERENSCYGCQVSLPSGEERRAACCWDIDELTVAASTYNMFFKDGGVRVKRTRNDRWMGEQVIVSFSGPCPNLDAQSGGCNIEEVKPMSCRDLTPIEDKLCARSRRGRHSRYSVPLNDVGV